MKPKRNHSLYSVFGISILILSSFYAWESEGKSNDKTEKDEKISKIKGRNLAKKVRDRPDGDDAISVVKMSLHRENSKTRVRSFYMYRNNPQVEVHNTLIRFIEPTNVEDIGLLTKDRPGDDSEQWIFLPKLKRSRKISSSRKGGRFVGSDYFYEDLQEREVDEDTHIYKGMVKLNGQKAYVLVSHPKKDSSTVYGKRISWVHKKSLIPLKTIFYDESGNKWKKLEVHKIQKIEGFWTVMDSSMENLKNSGHTRLAVQNIKYDVDIPTEKFSKQSLENPSPPKAFE